MLSLKVSVLQQLLISKLHCRLIQRFGIYTYKITEADSTTAGVESYENDIYLIVTVTQETNGLDVKYAFRSGSTTGEKINNTGITNTYNAGSLSVTKEVTGNMG